MSTVVPTLPHTHQTVRMMVEKLKTSGIRLVAPPTAPQKVCSGDTQKARVAVNRELWSHLNSGYCPLGSDLPSKVTAIQNSSDRNTNSRNLPIPSAGQWQKFRGSHRLSLWRAGQSRQRTVSPWLSVLGTHYPRVRNIKMWLQCLHLKSMALPVLQARDEVRVTLGVYRAWGIMGVWL